MANQMDIFVEQQPKTTVGEPVLANKKEKERQVYRKIAQMDSFKLLVKKKKKFLFSTTILFLIAYIMLPVLTSFTSVLEHRVIRKITWVWVYSLSLFVMTIVLCEVYKYRAGKFDKEVEKIMKEYGDSK